MEWNIPLALRYRKRVKNAKFNVTIEIVKSISVSIKFSQQAYAISRNVKLSWIIEMAFSLSPLSLSHFPFKINPIVENMHSTASDEALLASSVFFDWFQVFRLHMGLPEVRRIFVRLIICLTLQVRRYFCTNCFFNPNVNAVICSRWRCLLLGFDSSSWLPAELSMEVDELSASDSTQSLTADKSPFSRPVP